MTNSAGGLGRLRKNSSASCIPSSSAELMLDPGASFFGYPSVVFDENGT